MGVKFKKKNNSRIKSALKSIKRIKERMDEEHNYYMIDEDLCYIEDLLMNYLMFDVNKDGSKTQKNRDSDKQR